jgi:hypothetical protein
MVLTLGRSGAYTANPPEKGGKKNKKTVVLTLGSPSEKGGGKKKTLVLTLGRPPDFDFRTWSCPSVEVLSIHREPETKIGTWTDRQTDRHHLSFNI